MEKLRKILRSIFTVYGIIGYPILAFFHCVGYTNSPVYWPLRNILFPYKKEQKSLLKKYKNENGWSLEISCLYFTYTLFWLIFLIMCLNEVSAYTLTITAVIELLIALFFLPSFLAFIFKD